MRALVLDAGALVALHRDDRSVWAMLKAAAAEASIVEVPVGVIGQTWRHGARQALLARALKHCLEVPMDGTQARAAGVLCGASETADVIDATVALVAAGARAADSVAVLTSEGEDLRLLLGILDAGDVRVVDV